MQKRVVFSYCILFVGAGSASAGTFPEPERMIRNLHELMCAGRLSDPDHLDLEKISRALGPFEWGDTRTAAPSSYSFADKPGTRRRDFMWNSTMNTDEDGRANEGTPCLGGGEIIAQPDGLARFSTGILAGLPTCKVLDAEVVQRLYGKPNSRSDYMPPPLHAVMPATTFEVWLYRCSGRHSIEVSYRFAKPTGQLLGVASEVRLRHFKPSSAAPFPN